MTLAEQVTRLRRSRSGTAQPVGLDGRPRIFACRAICPPTRWCRATTTGCGRRCTWSRSVSAIASPAQPTPVRTRAAACRPSFGSSRSPASRDFPARSFINVKSDAQPGDGEWHDTPDKEWRWKGDTSSDEIVGHYFVYPLYLELVADEAEKPALRAVIDRITNHILDNNYQLIDVDGQKTTLGLVGPRCRSGKTRTKPACARCTSCRTCASRYHMTANAQYRARYQAAYDDLIKTAQVPLAHAQPEGHRPWLGQPLGRRAGVPVVLPAPALREGSRRSSRCTSRAWSEAGRSSGRSAIRSGISFTRPAPARRSSTGLSPCGRFGRSRWIRSSGRSGTPSGSTCRSIR